MNTNPWRTWRPWAESANRARSAGRRWLVGLFWAAALAALASTPASASGTEAAEFRFRHIGIDDGLAQGSVYAIHQDRRGFLWVGTQDGLHRFDGERFVVLRPEPFVADSLSHGLVQALAEDDAGGLWVGTFRGLDHLRRDGASFDSLWIGGIGEPAGAFQDLATASDGSLWAATLGDGLLRIDAPSTAWTDGSVDASRLQVFRTEDGLPSDRVRAVTVAADGTVWFGFESGDVTSLDPGTGGVQTLPDASLPGGAVQDLMLDDRGRLWIAALGGLGVHDPATGEGSVQGDDEGLSDRRVTSLLQDRQGRVWIGTLGGLCLSEDGEPGPYRCFRQEPGRDDSLSDDQVRALAEDAGGLIWVGTSLGGITLVDTRPRLGVVRHVPDWPGSLPVKAVRSFLQDDLGNLWVGTDGGGVVRRAGRREDHGFERPAFERPAYDRPIVARSDAGLADELARERVWSLHQSSSSSSSDPEPTADVPGKIWIGGQQALWSLTTDAAGGGRRLEVYRPDSSRDDALPSGGVRWILESDGAAGAAGTDVAEDGLWLAHFGGGVSFLSRQSMDAAQEAASFRHFRADPDDPRGLVSDLALVLHRHSSGDLWVGTAEGLSRRWSDQERFFTYRHDPRMRDSLVGDIVRVLHEDDDGNLWVGTDAGLNLLPAEAATGPPGAGANRFGFRHYTEDDGLPNHTVYGILPDAEGHLWLSTNQGLARFDPRTEIFVSFDRDDGLQALEFNGGAQLRDRDGRLYFGGVDGYNVFLPADVRRNEHVPPVVITAVRRLDGRPRDELLWRTGDEALEIGHRDRVVTFRFAALDFSHPEENRYAYRVDGLDPEGAWHDLGTENDLTFSGLDAGSYVLRVRGSNDDGVWNDEGASLPLRVRAAPWRSWWAWTLYVTAVALLLAVVFRQWTRRRALQERIHEVLRTSERRLDLALRGSGDGMWDWDIETGDIYRSHVDHLLGADAADVQVERPFADLEVHPDDLARVELELERHLEGASDRFEVEYRLREPGGGWRWILDRGDVVERDADGRPSRMAGTFKDMTRQKQVERELRLWSAVFESVSEGVLILDVWGRIRAANPAFARLTGWGRADLQDRRARALESKEHDRDFYRDIRRQLVDEGRWQGEVHQQRRDGSSFLAWVDLNTVRDDAGDISHFVAVCTDITRRKESEEELRRLANYDPLTGLPNRSQFQERLEEALVDARRMGHRVALLFGDLDRFKQINDTLGHSVGDLLLQEAARRLLRSVRERDIVSRLGGDEFTVLLTRVSDDDAVVVNVAERIQRSFTPVFELDGHEVSVSTSLGIAIFPEDGDSAERLIKHADTAMYEAKTAGRNRYRFWDRQMSRRALLRLNLESRLRRALDHGELELHYQPKFDVEAGRIVGFEALARWRKDGELVLPGSFLSLAEDTGLVLSLGPWVLETALEQLKTWPSPGDGEAAEPLRVAVNVSAAELLREGFAQRVATTLERRQVAPDRLILEISETALAEHLEALREVLETLHALGVHLSLDDFGTGHAALGHLENFPLREIKLDPSFLAQSSVGGESNPAVQAVVALARGLGVDVVAEGVETREQLEARRRDGCRLVQGFYLARPVAEADVPSCFADDAPWRQRLA